MKQDLNVFYQVCVIGPIGKIRWPPWRLIGWDIFDFFSETAERNSTKLDWKQDLNVFYQVCDFWADGQNKVAAPGSDLLRHFRHLFWNRWTEYDKTWQEARSQHSLRSLCFSGGSVRKRWPPWSMIGWDIFDFSSETAERDSKKFDRNLRKISTSSTKLCFSVWWVNKNYRPGWSVKKVAHCTQVHDMWPFRPLVYVFI